ncbi:MAG: hypothetical protein HYS23_03485 [Geobacter sp.]|nr:hypothetical protein [Geobacter sp.]
MSYLTVDLFTDQSKAQVSAQAFRDAGAQNVTIETVSSINVRDNSENPPVAKLYKNADALYVVICKG